MKISTEYRAYPELRVESIADDGLIIGHAAVFNVPANIAGMFVEVIAPGAFREAIRSDDVRALIEHDSKMIIGRNRAGTLKLSEDDIGLRVEITPPETQTGQDLLVSMRRGDLNQMSFGFSMRNGVEVWDDSGEEPTRTIEKVGQLMDVSVVAFPAFEGTDAAVRCLQEYRTQHAAGHGVNVGLLKRKLILKEHEFTG